MPVSLHPPLLTKLTSAGGDASATSTPQVNRPPNSTGPTPDLNAPIVIDDDDDPTPSAGAGAAGKTEPRKQSTWTQEMKDTFGQLLDNYQDMVELNKRLA
jgi:hypothetical protein